MCASTQMSVRVHERTCTCVWVYAVYMCMYNPLCGQKCMGKYISVCVCMFVRGCVNICEHGYANLFIVIIFNWTYASVISVMY